MKLNLQFPYYSVFTSILVLFAQAAIGQTFSSGTVNSAIIDDNCANNATLSSIPVSGLATAINGTFGLSQVCIRINHGYDGDLDIYLRAPDGHLVELSTDNGSSSSNYGSGTTYACFNMTSATNITAGVAPYTAAAGYRPEGNLGAVNNGQNPNGNWTLSICDDAAITAGTLVGWTLSFSGTPASPVVSAPTQGDCFAATPICANAYPVATVTAGAGSFLDINTNDPNLCLGTETNSSWYIFTAQATGQFGFNINPRSNTDDFDWALFDITGRTCADIYNVPSMLVSCNASSDVANSSTTGAGNTGAFNTGSFSNQGAGITGCPTPTAVLGCNNTNGLIPVTIGKTYVLYVSNYTVGGAGYDISFGGTGTTAGVIDNSAPTLQSVQQPIACGATSLTFSFSENVKCATVTASDFVLTGPGGPYTLSNISSASCTAGSPFSSTFSLNVSPALVTNGNYTLAISAGNTATDNCNNPTLTNTNLPFVITVADATLSYATATVCKNVGGTLSPTLTGTGGAFSSTAGLNINPTTGVIDIAASTAGVYTVSRTVTTGGCSDTKTAIVTINANPVPSIAGTPSFCAGSSTTLTASGGTTYAWSVGGTAAANTISTANTYTVTATTNGCTGTAQVVVSNNALPTPSIGAPAQLTCTTTSVTLTANGGTTYAWSGGGIGATKAVTATGIYTVTATDGNGCQGTSSVSVTNNITAPTVAITPSAAALNCSITNIDLAATGTGSTYAWTTAGGTILSGAALHTCTINAPGTYTVVSTNAVNGCTNSTNIAITRNTTAPVVSIAAPSVLTCGVLSTNLVASGGTAYAWSSTAGGNITSGVNLATAIVDAPATYTVTATNSANGCTASANIAVTQNITPPTVSIAAPPVLTCTTTNTTLTATAGLVAYTWSGNVASSATNTAVINAPSTYTVTATGSNGCVASTTIVVTQNITPPVPSITGNTYYCPAGSTTLTATNGVTYAWSGATTGATKTVSTAGTYTVTATAANGCTASTWQAITASTPPVLSNTISTCDPGSTSYNASFAIAGTSPFTVTYNGNTYPSGNTFTSLLVTGAQTFTVTNACGSAVYNATGVCAPPTTCGGASGCFGTNLVVNADFQAGNVGFTSQMTANNTPLGLGTCNPGDNDCNSNTTNAYYTPTTNDILCQGSYGIDVNVRQCNKFWSPNIKDHTTGTGKMMMIDFPNTYNAATNKLWCQTINLTAGTNYCFGAYFINLIPSTSSAFVDPIFGFTRAGVNLGTSVSVTEDEKWHFNGVSFTESTGGNVQLCINNLNAGGTGFDVAIDDISVRTVNNSGVLPITNNDVTALCPGKSQVVVNVLTNDLAGTGTIDYNTFKIIQAPAFSQAVISGINTAPNTIGALSGGGDVTLDFVNGYTGSTSFEYQICNTGGCCATATCTINNPGTNPTLALSGSTAICNGKTSLLMASAAAGSGSGYTYNWSNAANTFSQTVSPVANTTYTATVTDSYHCTATSSISVSVNSLPTLNAGANTPICINSNTSLNAIATGGNGTYTYTWNDGFANPHNVAPLATTLYTATVTDGNGCTNTANVSITVRPTPAVTIGAITPICQGGSTTMSASASGGTGSSYTYNWNNGLGSGATNSFTISPAATTIYNVTVSDVNGCTSTDNATATVRDLPTADAGVDRAICAGGNTNLVALAGGGSGTGYTFNWSNSAATASTTVTPANTTTYTVTITDSNTCQKTDNVVITVNPVAAATITGATAFCASKNTTLTANGTGTYAWSNGLTTPAITVTTAGTFTVTITDSNGCLATASKTTTINANPLPTITGPAVFCAGTPTNLTASGGNGYGWSTGAGAATLALTAGGTYTVTVTDGAGCTATLSKAVSMTALPSFTIAGASAVCAGLTANIAVSGAVGTYAWSNSATASNVQVAAGTYTVTVTANGCASSRSTTILSNPLPIPSISGNGSFCYGGNSLLDVGAYSLYNWNTGVATQTYNATAAGTFTVTVTDANGCTQSATKTVTQSANIIPTISGTTAICSGASTTLSTGTYNSYTWSDTPTTATQSATFGTAGNYTVTVSDAAGCTGSTSIAVTVNSNPIATITNSGGTAITTNTYCANGSVTAIATGGTSYAWSGTLGTSATAVINTAAVHQVTVTNAAGCTATASVSTTLLALPSVAITSNAAGGAMSLCSNTSVVLTATGGGTYTWQNGLNAALGATAAITVNGTSVNNAYKVTVTGTNGCTNTASTSLTVNAAPTTTITTSGGTAFCAGSSFALDAGAGFSAYAWNPTGGTTRVKTVTTAGTYTVTVTNGSGCTATASITTTQNALPTASINSATGGAITASFCDGNTNAILLASGGTSYAWTGGASTASISVSAANTYTVTVTNAQSCSATATVVVSALTLPTPTITSSASGGAMVLCANGSVSLTASGGSSYTWNNGLSANISNLAIANINGTAVNNPYTVTVTAANGCTNTASTSLTTNPQPSTTITTNAAGGVATFCASKNITLSAGNGFSNYLWTDNSTGSSITVSATGVNNYTVTATNSNGCTTTASIAVTQLANPVASVAGTTTICSDKNTTLTAAGGGTYLWSNNTTVAALALTNLTTSTTYTVTVTGANGCTTSVVRLVTVNANPVASIAGNAVYCSNLNTILTASGGGTYLWNNGLGANAAATVSGAPTNPYTVTVTNTNGCTNTASINLTQNIAPTTSIGTSLSSDVVCSNAPTTLTAGGGFNNYQWSGGVANTNTTVITTAGNYTVTVTNASGCTAVASINIAASPAPTPAIAGAAQLCTAQTTSTLTASSTTGTGLAYLWSNNATTASITASTGGNYTVTITTAAGCVSSTNLVVAGNALPTPSINGNTTTCSGTSINLSTNIPYSAYLWSAGAPNTAATITVPGGATYTVTVTDGNGCTNQASITVNQNASPTTSIGASLNTSVVCSNAPTTLTAGSGFSNYQWSGGVVNTNTTVITTAGIYSVTVTNASGCTGVASINIAASPAPTPLITGAGQLCTGQTTTTLTASSTTGAGLTYAWSNSPTTANNTVSTGGIYTVTITTAGLCVATATRNVTANPLPIAGITGTTAFCASSNTVLTAVGGTSQIWSTSATTPTLTVTTPNTYSVVVTDANGCKATTATSVTLNALPPTFTIATSNNTNGFCTGTSLTLSAPTGYVYAWSGTPTVTTASKTVTTAGLYTVTITNVDGCTRTANTTVVVNALPTASITAAGGTAAFCAGSSLSLSANGGVSYVWNTGSGASITVNTAGTYTVTATDANNCTATATVLVTQNALPNLTISGANAYCVGFAPTLTANVTNVTGSGFVWSNGLGNLATATPTGTNTYFVTATSAAGCTAIASIAVTQNANSGTTITTATGNITLCGGANVNLDAGQTPGGANFSAYTWSGGLGTNRIVTVSAAGNYTVTVTDGNGCTFATSITITGLTNPTVAIANVTGGAASFCPGSTLALTASGANTYIWTNGVVNTNGATLNIATNGTYTVTATATNGCTASSVVAASFLVAPVPVFIPASGLAVCSNGSLTITASGGVSYAWNTLANTSNITIQGNALTNNYIVTVTGTNGCTASATAPSITFNQAPNPTIITNTGSGEFCEGTTLTLNAGSNFASYVWSDNTTQSTLTVSAGGDYTVTVTDGNGCTNSRTVNIIRNLNPLPTITVTPSGAAFCAGNSVQLAAVANALPLTQYEWSLNNATTASIPVLLAGTYTVTVTDTKGCKGSSSTSITTYPPPVVAVAGVNAGAANFCTGGSVSITASGAGIGGVYGWTGGSTNANLTVTAAGTYIVTVTTAQGCTASSSVIVTRNDSPTVSISASNNLFTVCSGAAITLTATGGGTYDWGGGNTNSALQVSTAGNYTVTVTSAAGCTASLVKSVTTGTNPVVVISPNTQYCPNSTVTITASGAGAGGSYLWTGGSTSPTYTTNASGTYIVTLTNAVGCKASSAVVVSESPNPSPNITIVGGTTFVCSGQSTTLDAGGPFATYQWARGGTLLGTNPTQTVTSGGDYYVTVTNTAGCRTIVNRSIQENASPIIVITGLNTNPNFCSGANTTLTASTGLNNYVWSSGQTSVNSITVTTGGTYTVTASLQGCTSTANIFVQEKALPTINIQAVPEFCAGKTIIMQATGSGTYVWSNGGTSAIKSITEGGTYTVTITAADGCTNTHSTTIVRNALPNANAGADFEAYPGEFFALNASGGSTYLWSNPNSGNTLTSNNIPNPIGNQIYTTQVYTVTVTDNNGCTASDNVTVTLGEALKCLGESEGITPNGDGFNDYWSIGCLIYFKNHTVEVFNRWGQSMFASDKYNNDWDATSNGSPLPDGTYYYVITIQTSDVNKKTIYRGNLTIIR
jgi:large repetitive protein